MGSFVSGWFAARVEYEERNGRQVSGRRLGASGGADG